MAFQAVKIKFSWSISMAQPWIPYQVGSYSSSRSQLQLTLHFFMNHYWNINSNPGWIEKYKPALSKLDSSWDNSYWGY